MLIVQSMCKILETPYEEAAKQKKVNEIVTKFFTRAQTLTNQIKSYGD